MEGRKRRGKKCTLMAFSVKRSNIILVVMRLKVPLARRPRATLPAACPRSAALPSRAAALESESSGADRALPTATRARPGRAGVAVRLAPLPLATGACMLCAFIPLPPALRPLFLYFSLPRGKLSGRPVTR